MKHQILLVLFVSIFFIMTINLVSASLTDGIISYYALNESVGTTASNSVNTLNYLTTSGSPTWVSGKIGNALNISAGTQAYAENTTFKAKGNLTLNGWFYVTSADADDRLVVIRNDTGTEFNLNPFFSNSTNLRADVFDGVADRYVDFNYAPYFNQWVMITMRVNGTNNDLFVNGNYIGTAIDTFTFYNNYDFILGNDRSGLRTRALNGIIDEVGIWNTTLSNADIVSLYNNGGGNTYPFFGNSIVLNSPANNAVISSSIFNATIFMNTTLSNASIYITDTLGNIFNKTTNTITGTTNTTIWNINNLNPNNYIWYVEACGTNGFCFNSTNSSFTYGLSNVSSFYNQSTYETNTESYIMNFSVVNGYSPSGFLWYNGTKYSPTITNLVGNTWKFSNTFDVPLLNIASGENRTFFWQINIGGLQYNTTSSTQVVNNITLALCRSSPLNVAFINLTFINETTSLEKVGASLTSSWTYWFGTGAITKSLSFSNSTENTNYAFCFNPASATMKYNVSLQFANSYSQARNNYFSSSATNTTTNIVNYLLPTSQGITTAIQTVLGIGSPISGVDVVAERQINGVWSIVGSVVSDSSGLATFFLNPNYDYRITGTLVGYQTNQITIRPSQTQYTLIMSNLQNSNVTFIGSTEGMKWIIFPGNGQVNGTVLFGMNLTAINSNLLGCREELIQSDTGAILATTTISGISGCNISISYNIPTEVRVFGKFYISTTTSGGYFLIDGDALWYTFETSNRSPWTYLTGMFHDLNNAPEFGSSELRQEFSHVIWFFFVLTFVIGLLTFFTEYDRLYPGFFIIIVFAIVAIASKGGFLTLNFGTTTSGAAGALPQVFKQYTIMMITGLFTSGYLLNRWAKEA